MSLLTVFTVVFGYAQSNSLTGNVNYKNTVNTPMVDSTFVNLYQGNIVMYSVAVDASGHYEIGDIIPGTYTLKASCTKTWGGVNAVDALLIERHYVGLPPLLTGLNLVVGDVNQSGGTIGAVDALACVRRWAQSIQNFAPAPDWYSTSHNIVINTGDFLTQDIKLLCAGDVNGSYIPN